ncbi:hypothetical protein [Methylobacter psychrophilus]|uniref:hypothetical protein n=1 Tax=Methylobacter psychrophilus TaxID=96941 RepID=UPI0021D4E52A|nr:hypothetical protein [Methylobacter psychrophilus]
MKTISGCVDFRLNERDEIIAVGSEWDHFAFENHAPELIGSKVIGRPLLDFISGNVTRQFVQALLQLVRSGTQSIELEYRCDSPTERRYMQMRVSLEESGLVHFMNTFLRTESRKNKILISTATQRGKNTTVRCSMCNLVKPLKDWIEPELFDGSNTSKITEWLVIYGICEVCETSLQRASSVRTAVT